MKINTNPTEAEIFAAIAICERTPRPAVLTADRYAMNQNETAFIDSKPAPVGTIAHGIRLLQCVQYINIYGSGDDAQGVISYQLRRNNESFPMYDSAAIKKAGFIPVHPNRLPEYFDNIDTVIIEN